MTAAPPPPSPAPATPGARARRSHGRRIVTKLLFSIVVLVVMVLVAEVAVRLFVPVRSVGPVGTTYDPVYGKRLKRSYSVKRIGQEFTYTLSTNSLGFRGPEPASTPKGSVVFLGDSFTMGSTVNDGEEYPALVGEKLDEEHGEGTVPVVNAGIAHTGNGRWVKFLRLEAERYEPRFVVMQFFLNDFADNVNERLFTLDDAGELVERPVPPQSRAKRLQAFVESIPILQYSYLVAIGRQAVANVAFRGRAGAHGTDPESQDPLTYRIFEEALGVCAEHGWPAGVIMTELREDQEEALREIADRFGVTLIRIPSKKERPDLYWKVNGHWDQRGHAYVADVVYRDLIRATGLAPAGGSSSD